MRPPAMASALLLLVVSFAMSVGADSGAALSPVNITTTLVNAGKFNTLVDLLQSSGLEAPLMQKQTSSGITVFAPTDDAFSSLPAGELASLTPAQVTSLLEYHVLPSYFTLTSLEAISGPSVLTLASDKTGKPALSISTSSDTVTLKTGLDSAQILTTLIDQYPLVAVYVINAVLLPSDAGPTLGAPVSTPPPVEAPGSSPSLAAGAPALSPGPSLAVPPSPELTPNPAPRIPSPFFRPFAPPGMGNPGNGPEAAPAAPGPSSGVTCPQLRSKLAAMVLVLLYSVL